MSVSIIRQSSQCHLLVCIIHLSVCPPICIYFSLSVYQSTNLITLHYIMIMQLCASSIITLLLYNILHFGNEAMLW